MNAKIARVFEYYRATEYTQSEQLMAAKIVQGLMQYDAKLLMAVGCSIVDGLSRGLKDVEVEETEP